MYDNVPTCAYCSFIIRTYRNKLYQLMSGNDSSTKDLGLEVYFPIETFIFMSVLPMANPEL